MEHGPSSDRKRPLVAIVDDEESVLRALKRLMRSAGIAVEVFGSGAEFLESLDANAPDCVVLDLHMPRMSGFDVQKSLVQRADAVPVIAITGHDTPESRQRAMAAGAAAYLRKPVDDRVLLDAVMTVIGGKA